MERIKTIVVPVDFYENTDKLVNYAAYIGEALSAKLNFVNVVNLVSGDAMLGAPLSAEFQTRYRKEMQRRMKELVAAMQERCEGSTGEVVTGEPVRDIVAYAKENKGDLIIISTHGTKGLESILLGSVARRVVKNAHCPVLVMNPFKSGPQDS